jgi:serine/threonine protein kinase
MSSENGACGGWPSDDDLRAVFAALEVNAPDMPNQEAALARFLGALDSSRSVLAPEGTSSSLAVAASLPGVMVRTATTDVGAHRQHDRLYAGGRYQELGSDHPQEAHPQPVTGVDESGARPRDSLAESQRLKRAWRSAKTAWRSMKWAWRFGRLVRWITGYEATAPDTNRSESLLYAALGLMVLATTCLAAFSMTVILNASAHGLPILTKVVVTAGWAFTVFSVDLLMARQINYRGGRGFVSRVSSGVSAALLFLTRVILAFAMAFLVSEPIVAFAFRDVVFTGEEAEYVSWAHRAVFALVVTVDLFPILAKQGLRNSRYALRIQEEIRKLQAIQRADTEDLEAQLRIRRRGFEHDAERIDLRLSEEIRRLRDRTFSADIDLDGPHVTPLGRRSYLTLGELGVGDIVDHRWELVQQMHDRPGYSALWQARDIKPDTPRGAELSSQYVALKFIYPQADGAGFAEEIRAVKEMHGGPHIAPILATGKIRGSAGDQAAYYFVQPFYPLGSLDKYLRSYRLNLRFCLAVTDQVLRGLDWAHFEAMRLHLDIKPMNIVMAPVSDGGGRHEAHIIDWGLATHLSLNDRGHVTARGPGTPWFSAPEQFTRRASGEDSRCQESDIYGVGATLYFLLANRPPLQREFQAIYPHGSLVDFVDFLGSTLPPVPTPVHEIVSDIPRPVSDLVQRWLSFDPHDRVDTYDATVPHAGAAYQARLALRAVAREVSDQLKMPVGPSAGPADANITEPRHLPTSDLSTSMRWGIPAKVSAASSRKPPPGPMSLTA